MIPICKMGKTQQHSRGVTELKGAEPGFQATESCSKSRIFANGPRCFPVERKKQKNRELSKLENKLGVLEQNMPRSRTCQLQISSSDSLFPLCFQITVLPDFLCNRYSLLLHLFTSICHTPPIALQEVLETQRHRCVLISHVSESGNALQSFPLYPPQKE